MKPYATSTEAKIGDKRPRISHAPPGSHLPRAERQAEKRAVVSERRAIKKSARRHLKQALLTEWDESL